VAVKGHTVEQKIGLLGQSARGTAGLHLAGFAAELS